MGSGAISETIYFHFIFFLDFEIFVLFENLFDRSCWVTRYIYNIRRRRDGGVGLRGQGWTLIAQKKEV